MSLSGKIKLSFKGLTALRHAQENTWENWLRGKNFESDSESAPQEFLRIAIGAKVTEFKDTTSINRRQTSIKDGGEQERNQREEK